MKKKLLSILYKTNFFHLMRRLTPGALTVLNYHRVIDVKHPGFDMFKPNVSASPDQFAEQMDYLLHYYNIISTTDLLQWLRGEKNLPEHAALITFDDGYFDNLLYAFPILHARNLPATIFLTVDFIQTGKPFYWDQLAYAFFHSCRESVSLPGLGQNLPDGLSQRELLLASLVQRLKFLPEAQKRATVQQVIDVLDVDCGSMPRLSLTWDEIRPMQLNGIEFGSHTLSHPILSRVPLDQAMVELTESRRILEENLGRPVLAFAYPNGHRPDITDEVVKLASQSGYQCAFTLQPGPTRYSTVRKNPFLVRRVFISAKDTLESFAAKLAGLPRLAYAFRGSANQSQY